MTSRYVAFRVSGAVGLVVALAVAAEAGPPLICHPFTTGPAKLLPWETAASGWNTPDRARIRRQCRAVAGARINGFGIGVAVS